jgi:hypothetical protein
MIRYNIKVVPVHIMKVDGQVGVQFHSFLTSALDGGEWLASWTSPLIPRETDHVTH